MCDMVEKSSMQRKERGEDVQKRGDRKVKENRNKPKSKKKKDFRKTDQSGWIVGI